MIRTNVDPGVVKRLNKFPVKINPPGGVDRLATLPSKEQQLPRTQHFIPSSHTAMFVLHTE